VKQAALSHEVSIVAVVVANQMIPPMPLLDPSLRPIIPSAPGAIQLPVQIRRIAVIVLFPPA
jgi:hypothetical protein